MASSLPEFRAGKLCYLELPARDVEVSAAFYQDVFGWKIRRRSDGSVAFDDTVGQVSGTFVTGLPPAAVPGLLAYVMVADGPAAAAAVRAAGGSVARPIDPADGEVFFWFADPAGNVLGAYQQPGLGDAQDDGAQGRSDVAAAAGSRPYARGSNQGPRRNFGADFIIKASEFATGAAVAEYVTRQGEEPPDHVHPSEDEMFYVLGGELAFRCGGERLEASEGSFVFLPRGVEHGYQIRGPGEVRLLVITAPPRDRGDGWAGFLGDVERDGSPV